MLLRFCVFVWGQNGSVYMQAQLRRETPPLMAPPKQKCLELNWIHRSLFLKSACAVIVSLGSPSRPYFPLTGVALHG